MGAREWDKLVRRPCRWPWVRLTGNATKQRRIGGWSEGGRAAAAGRSAPQAPIPTAA